MTGWRPPHAYIPGLTPRHPEALFDGLKEVGQGALADAPAWSLGLELFDARYYWEAHEVWEPVWMAAPPNSAEAQLLRGVIALANAGLKRRMGRDRAAVRLDKLADAFLTDAMQRGAAMGLDAAQVRAMRDQVLGESVYAL